MSENPKWEQPKVLDVSSLPEAWGHCVGGSTETEFNCSTGQKTTRSSDTCTTGGSAPGGCVFGSAAG